MNKITLIVFVVLIIGAGILGYIAAPDKTDNSAIELERKIFQNKEKVLQGEVDSLRSLSNRIAMKRFNDSIDYAQRIKTQEVKISKLTRSINEISLKNASVHDLDSIRIALYGK